MNSRYSRSRSALPVLLVGLLFVLPAIAAQDKILSTPTQASKSTDAKQSSPPDASDDRKRWEEHIKSRGLLQNRYSFRMVLENALPPGRISRDAWYEKQFGSRFFLFLVWLNHGDPAFGLDYALTENGRETSARYIFPDGGIQGGSQHEKNAATCRELQAISLPKGLSGPYAVPYNRILVVGLRAEKTGKAGKTEGAWQVRYYDRDNLPKQIQTIARLADAPFDY